MTNYTQLYKEDRDSIEELLKKGYSFTDIARNKKRQNNYFKRDKKK